MTQVQPTAGSRLSYNGDLCTVRYVGPVSTWPVGLGVEWDSPDRGKHSGTLNGVRFFTVKVPGSASFVKPSRSPDVAVDFFSALLEKYATVQKNEVIAISKSKTIETLGLDGLTQLEKIATISLSHSRINSYGSKPSRGLILPRVTTLDLAYNLISWDTVLKICSTETFPALALLNLAGNRLDTRESLASVAHDSQPNIAELILSDCLITSTDLCSLCSWLPNLSFLSLASNRLSDLPCLNRLELLKEIDLSDNAFEEIPTSLSNQPIQSLNMANNPLATFSTKFAYITALNLANCHIRSLAEVKKLPALFPSVQSLRINGNPFYEEFRSEEANQQSQVVDLLITGIWGASLKKLNGIPLSADDLKNAELFLISKVASGLVLFDHLDERWQQLCALHGAPEVRKPEAETISKRVIRVSVIYGNEVAEFQIARHSTVQKTLVRAARHFGLSPKACKLTLEGKDLDLPLQQLDYYTDVEATDCTVELVKNL